MGLSVNMIEGVSVLLDVTVGSKWECYWYEFEGSCGCECECECGCDCGFECGY